MLTLVLTLVMVGCVYSQQIIEGIKVQKGVYQDSVILNATKKDTFQVWTVLHDGSPWLMLNNSINAVSIAYIGDTLNVHKLYTGQSGIYPKLWMAVQVTLDTSSGPMYREGFSAANDTLIDSMYVDNLWHIVDLDTLTSGMEAIKIQIGTYDTTQSAIKLIIRKVSKMVR